jgi:hypothetical protein
MNSVLSVLTGVWLVQLVDMVVAGPPGKQPTVVAVPDPLAFPDLPRKASSW